MPELLELLQYWAMVVLTQPIHLTDDYVNSETLWRRCPTEQAKLYTIELPSIPENFQLVIVVILVMVDSVIKTVSS